MKCKDKVKYFSESAAQFAFHRMKKASCRKKGGYSIHGIRVYQCHVCGYYHLGHRPSSGSLEMIRLHSNSSVLEWKEFILKEILQDQYHMDAGKILTNRQRIA
jgi:hypothetical protein